MRTVSKIEKRRCSKITRPNDRNNYVLSQQNSKNFLLELTWLIVPTFDTKVTEYLCSGWVFFLQTKFDFLTSHF